MVKKNTALLSLALLLSGVVCAADALEFQQQKSDTQDSPAKQSSEQTAAEKEHALQRELEELRNRAREEDQRKEDEARKLLYAKRAHTEKDVLTLRSIDVSGIPADKRAPFDVILDMRKNDLQQEITSTACEILNRLDTVEKTLWPKFVANPLQSAVVECLEPFNDKQVRQDVVDKVLELLANKRGLVLQQAARYPRNIDFNKESAELFNMIQRLAEETPAIVTAKDPKFYQDSARNKAFGLGMAVGAVVFTSGCWVLSKLKPAGRV